MDRELKLDYEDTIIKSFVVDEIAVIKFKCNVFEAIIDLEESGKFMALIRSADRNPHIKALLLLNEPGCFGDEAYDKFIKKISAPNEGQDKKQLRTFGKCDRTREINILNQMITHLVEFRKISAVGFQGSVVTPFFGAALSVDFRYGAEDTSFSLSHIKHGLHPTGALPFFLPLYVGHSQAVEILFAEEQIDVRRAKELGLITRIFANVDFEKQCIAELGKLCRLESRAIYTTKLLVNFSRSALRSYFDLESALIY